MFEIFNKYNNLNYFINREKHYNPIGRMQTELQAINVDAEIKYMLEKNNISHSDIYGNPTATTFIVKDILEKLKRS